MTRFDTDADTPATRYTVPLYEAIVKELAQDEAAAKAPVENASAHLRTSKKRAARKSGSQVNREASNRVARHHPRSRGLDSLKIGQQP